MTCFTPRFAEGHPLRRDLELAIYVLPRGKMGGRRDALDASLPSLDPLLKNPYKIAETSKNWCCFWGLLLRLLYSFFCKLWRCKQIKQYGRQSSCHMYTVHISYIYIHTYMIYFYIWAHIHIYTGNCFYIYIYIYDVSIIIMTVVSNCSVQ